jgi:hypothetical protein
MVDLFSLLALVVLMSFLLAFGFVPSFGVHAVDKTTTWLCPAFSSSGASASVSVSFSSAAAASCTVETETAGGKRRRAHGHDDSTTSATKRRRPSPAAASCTVEMETSGGKRRHSLGDDDITASIRKRRRLSLAAASLPEDQEASFPGSVLAVACLSEADIISRFEALPCPSCGDYSCACNQDKSNRMVLPLRRKAR